MSKYRAVPTIVDGIRFASKKEARRYGELKLLEHACKIRDFHIQPRFRLTVNGRHICDYIGDFSYLDASGRVIEDVKGVKTPIYRLKKKLMRAIHYIEITEV